MSPCVAARPRPSRFATMNERQDLLVALAGQQNAGKSTLFNLLTGARQHVANYPG
ncbi:MAG: 50S ribosome-binding GTPase, partial [Chromatiaceae bacterium]|nr:50S ribosome-binding GTPase [Chromatiaceae bacterium]